MVNQEFVDPQEKPELPKDGSGNSPALNGGDILYQDHLEKQAAKKSAATDGVEAGADKGKAGTPDDKNAKVDAALHGGKDLGNRTEAAAVAGAEAGAKAGDVVAHKDGTAHQHAEATPFNEAEFRKQIEKLTPQEQREMLKANEKSIEAFKAGMMDTLQHLAEAHPEAAKEFEAVKKAIEQYGVINSWNEVASQKH